MGRELTLIFAVVLSTLPPLPQRGLALETRSGVELQTLSGRAVRTLAGVDLAYDQTIAHKLVVRDRRGRLFVLEGRRLRPTPLRRGCRTTDVALVVCARTIKSRGRVVARAPRGIGHWLWAVSSPRGDAILAQWSAECEVPVAYLVADGKLCKFGDETVALGWLPSGEALVHYREGGCGGSGRAGIYAVPRSGKPRLIRRTARFAQYAMWGG